MAGLRRVGPKITFDKASAGFILKTFGYSVKDGVVVGPDGHPAREIAGEQPVKVEDFVGVMKNKKGEVVIIANSIFSIIEATEHMSWETVESEPEEEDNG